MNLSGYLQRHNLVWETVVGAARRAIGLRPGDILFAAGSLIEDLGNEASDLDLFLITERDDIAYTSLRDVAFTVGKSIIDIRVLQYQEVNAILQRFTRWAEQNGPSRGAFAFTEDERKFLHRLHSGLLIDGAAAFEVIRAQATAQRLARHKLDWARHLAATIRIDLMGLRAESEYESMLLAGQELLWHSADALLAAHGHVNPNPKWRIKLLRRLPADWEDALPGRPSHQAAWERYLALHRGPSNLSSTSIAEHVLEIATFTRNVIFGAERELLGSTPARRPTQWLVPNAGGPCLPVLDMDFSFRCEGVATLGYRAGSDQEFCQLSDEASQLLALFDGRTSLESAALYGDALTGGQGEPLLQHVLQIVRQRGYAVPAMIDEERLSAILRR
jgi:hypothetical protein